MAETVVEVSISRTCSSSRNWAMKVPVALGRFWFFTRSAWPKTTSEMRISARLPTMSMMAVLTLRMMKSKTTATPTPMNRTTSVLMELAGTTRS
ncbi:hypothetical protein D3C87_1785990 [compost metagenome]